MFMDNGKQDTMGVESVQFLRARSSNPLACPHVPVRAVPGGLRKVLESEIRTLEFAPVNRTDTRIFDINVVEHSQFGVGQVVPSWRTRPIA